MGLDEDDIATPGSVTFPEWGTDDGAPRVTLLDDVVPLNDDITWRSFAIVDGGKPIVAGNFADAEYDGEYITMTWEKQGMVSIEFLDEAE